MTVRVTVSPILRLMICCGSSSTPVMGWPSTAVITSPGRVVRSPLDSSVTVRLPFRPAAAAGLPWYTRPIRTPCSGSFACLRSAALRLATSLIPTPRLGVWITPPFPACNSGRSFLTVFTGIAKPTPALWPIPPVRIWVFTPMTCPALFSSGPPLLPGLMAASVWMTFWFTPFVPTAT